MTLPGRASARRRLVLLALVVAVAVGGFFAYRAWFTGDSSTEESFTTIAAATMTLQATIATSGTAQAMEQTALSFPIAGKVGEIFVELGDEVKADQPLARLETEDLETRVATAQTNLALAQIRLRQLLAGADASEIAAAKDAVAAAAAVHNKGVNDLADLLEQPTDVEVASKQRAVDSAAVTVVQAQWELDKLLEGASAAELAGVEQTLEMAEANLEAAENNLDALTSGASSAAVAAAEASVAAAEANLAAAENLEDSAEITLQAAESGAQIAFNAYCADLNSDATTCSSLDIPLSSAEVVAVTATACPQNDPNCVNALIVNALIGANTAYVGAQNSLESAGGAVDSARAALEAAEEQLDELEDGADASDIAAAEAAVESAEAGVEAAQAALDEVREGADPQDVVVARAAVAAAEQALRATQLDRDDAVAGPTDRDISNALAALESATASLEAAKARRDKVLAGADRDDIDLQREQVRLAELGLQQAEKALSDATVVAPYDGIVAALPIRAGELVGPALPALTLLSPGVLRLDLTIGETELPKMRVGQDGVIQFDAIQERPFVFTITAIGLAPLIQQGVVTYDVRALLPVGDDVPPELRPAPGMNGSALIVTERKADVLAVPSRVIRRRGNDQIIEVLVNGEIESRVVTLGVTGGDNTEVLSGLEPGEEVVLRGAGRPGAEADETPEALPEDIR